MNKAMPIAVLSLAAALLPAPAPADGGKRITGEQARRILQDAGYKAVLDKDGVGDPLIISSMGGLTVHLYFYDCEAEGCGSLKLSVGLDLEDGTTPEVVADFNRQHRYAKAFLDDENDPFLHYDFEVLYTDHAAHVTSQIGIWEELLNAFVNATGFRSGGSIPPPR